MRRAVYFSLLFFSFGRKQSAATKSCTLVILDVWDAESFFRWKMRRGYVKYEGYIRICVKYESSTRNRGVTTRVTIYFAKLTI